MKLFFSMMILLVIWSCTKDNTEPVPKACFTLLQDTISIGDTLNVSNCSEDSKLFLWDFGDSLTSDEQHPLHIYSDTGQFNIKLTVKNDFSEDTVSKYVYVYDKYYKKIDTYLFSIGGYKSYLLDIDRDSIDDIRIAAGNHYGNFGSLRQTYSVEISVMNGYEISYMRDIDTIKSKYRFDTIYNIETYSLSIPTIYKAGDVIKSTGDYTSNPLSIARYYRETFYTGGELTEITESNRWVGSDYKYLAVRKEIKSGYILAWLKVKVTSDESIHLIECRYYLDQDEVIISE